MTLIITGYVHKTGFHTEYPKLPNEFEVVRTPTDKSQKKSGIFSIADSVITTIGGAGKIPLLKGFKKIVNMPIKLWKPYFVGSNFRGYFSTFLECECFIAFAGSTLTSQHVLNLISNHLSELRIDYRSKRVGSGDFIVVKSCDHNELISTASFSQYDDDLFIPDKDYAGLLTADVIVDVVEHSINKALSSAKEFRLSEKAFNEMYTEFTLGINCPATGEDVIYQFDMDKRLNSDGVFEVFVNKQRIAENQVSIIGMRNEFKNRIDDVVESAINNNINLCDELTNFMAQAISEVDERGSFEIGRPIVVKKLKDGKLKKISVQ